VSKSYSPLNPLSVTLQRYLSGITVLLALVTTAPLYAAQQESAPTEAIATLSGPAISATAPTELKQAAQPDKISGEYIKGYFSDTGRMLVSPAHWDGSDWLKTGLILGTTAGLIFNDASIRDVAQRNQSSFGDKAATIGNALGNPLYTLPPLGLFYLYGHLNDDSKARHASLLAVESLAVSGAFTWTVKIAAQRPRPQTGEDATTWNGPRLKMGDYSFPSGHTTAAFSVASVLAEEYGTNPFVPPIAYSLATLTAFARVYDNKHWASDTFFGGAIGYFVGKAVVRYHSGPDSNHLKLLPTVSQQGVGLIAEYRF
jgi:membrane-associated phospholipid phosphatase